MSANSLAFKDVLAKARQPPAASTPTSILGRPKPLGQLTFTCAARQHVWHTLRLGTFLRPLGLGLARYMHTPHALRQWALLIALTSMPVLAQHGIPAAWAGAGARVLAGLWQVCLATIPEHQDRLLVQALGALAVSRSRSTRLSVLHAKNQCKIVEEITVNIQMYLATNLSPRAFLSGLWGVFGNVRQVHLELQLLATHVCGLLMMVPELRPLVAIPSFVVGLHAVFQRHTRGLVDLWGIASAVGQWALTLLRKQPGAPSETLSRDAIPYTTRAEGEAGASGAAMGTGTAQAAGAARGAGVPVPPCRLHAQSHAAAFAAKYIACQKIIHIPALSPDYMAGVPGQVRTSTIQQQTPSAQLHQHFTKLSQLHPSLHVEPRVQVPTSEQLHEEATRLALHAQLELPKPLELQHGTPKLLGAISGSGMLGDQPSWHVLPRVDTAHPEQPPIPEVTPRNVQSALLAAGIPERSLLFYRFTISTASITDGRSAAPDPVCAAVGDGGSPPESPAAVLADLASRGSKITATERLAHTASLPAAQAVHGPSAAPWTHAYAALWAGVPAYIHVQSFTRALHQIAYNTIPSVRQAQIGAYNMPAGIEEVLFEPSGLGLASLVSRPSDLRLLDALFEPTVVRSATDLTVRLLIQVGYTHTCLLRLALYGIERAVRSCRAGSTLLRSQTVGTSMMSQLCSMVAGNTLNRLLHPTISAVLAREPMSDLGAPRPGGGASARPASGPYTPQEIQDYVRALVAYLVHHESNMPIILRIVCIYISRAVRKRFPAMSRIGVNGLLFLRLLGPRLICPHAFGITETAPAGHAQQALLLVSKLLQFAANGRAIAASDGVLAPYREFVHTMHVPIDALIGRLCAEPVPVLCAGAGAVSPAMGGSMDAAPSPPEGGVQAVPDILTGLDYAALDRALSYALDGTAPAPLLSEIVGPVKAVSVAGAADTAAASDIEGVAFGNNGGVAANQAMDSLRTVPGLLSTLLLPNATRNAYAACEGSSPDFVVSPVLVSLRHMRANGSELVRDIELLVAQHQELRAHGAGESGHTARAAGRARTEMRPTPTPDELERAHQAWVIWVREQARDTMRGLAQVIVDSAQLGVAIAPLSTHLNHAQMDATMAEFLTWTKACKQDVNQKMEEEEGHRGRARALYSQQFSPAALMTPGSSPTQYTHQEIMDATPKSRADMLLEMRWILKLSPRLAGWVHARRGTRGRWARQWLTLQGKVLCVWHDPEAVRPEYVLFCMEVLVSRIQDPTARFPHQFSLRTTSSGSEYRFCASTGNADVDNRNWIKAIKRQRVLLATLGAAATL